MEDVKPILTFPRNWIRLSPPMEDFKLVLRLTRHWIHYGFLAHIGICVIVAAVKGLLGR